MFVMQWDFHDWFTSSGIIAEVENPEDVPEALVGAAFFGATGESRGMCKVNRQSRRRPPKRWLDGKHAGVWVGHKARYVRDGGCFLITFDPWRQA